MNAIPKHVRAEYGQDHYTVRYGCNEFHVPTSDETALTDLIADFNEMVDELRERADRDLREKIGYVLDGVDDDSVSSMQDALEEIRTLTERDDDA